MKLKHSHVASLVVILTLFVLFYGIFVKYKLNINEECSPMKFFDANIMQLAKENTYFRKEVVTGEYSQVVLMSVQPGEDVGKEIHQVDQTLFFIEGNGQAVLDEEKNEVGPGSLVFVPAGMSHNFINTGNIPLKLITVYAPAEHKPGTVHKTKAEVESR